MLSTEYFESIPAGNLSFSCRRLNYGVGINDAPFITNIKIDGRTHTHPAMKCWSHMLERCYSKRAQERHPTYIGVTVCDEWISFMGFFAWWKANQVDNWFIDKDILTDDMVYSPSSCLFVPRWLNNLLLDPKRKRDGLPIGANWHQRVGAYQARVCDFKTGKRRHIGYFSSIEEANMAYINHKIEVATSLKPDMDSIDSRIYPRVIEIINRMK